MKKKLFGVSKQTGGIVAGATVNLDAGNASSYSGSGTDWFDLTANNYDATLVNGVGYDSGNGGTLVFDGSNDYVLSNSTPQILSSQPFTIEAWWNTDAITTFHVITTWKTNGTHTIGFAITPPSFFSGYGTMTFGSQTTGFAKMKINDPIYINTWYHTILTFNGLDINNSSSYKYYMNGVSKTILYSSAYAGNANISRIGSGVGTEYFDGKIPISNLYLNKEFTQEEVTQNFDFYKGRFGL